MTSSARPADRDAAKAPATPVPAASIVILRDGRDGIETFMLQRPDSDSMAFAGALVFPGGKVDVADKDAAWDALAPATPAVPERPFWIASVRETFEEAGFLIAQSAGQSAIVDAARTKRLVGEERARSARPAAAAFTDMIRRERLALAVDQLIHFGHWITPASRPKRFDTHFFLVAAPVAQTADHDAYESAEAMWIAPAEALRQYDAGKRALVAVTHFTLSLLSTWPTVEQAVAAARARRIVTVMPTATKTPEGRLLRIPPEAGYVTSELLMRE